MFLRTRPADVRTPTHKIDRATHIAFKVDLRRSHSVYIRKVIVAGTDISQRWYRISRTSSLPFSVASQIIAGKAFMSNNVPHLDPITCRCPSCEIIQD